MNNKKKREIEETTKKVMKLSAPHMDILTKITNLANETLENLRKIITPQVFKRLRDDDSLEDTIYSFTAMIAASEIYQLSLINKSENISDEADKFLEKLNLALKWRIFSNTDKETMDVIEKTQYLDS